VGLLFFEVISLCRRLGSRSPQCKTRLLGIEDEDDDEYEND
jgi:hypothetical protein